MTKDDFLENGKWKCTKCGACCHFVKWFIPDLDRGDGACIYLTPTNECSIYESRPDICRTDKMPPSTEEEKADACALVYNAIKNPTRTDP